MLSYLELLYELVQPNNGDDSEKLSQSGGSEVVTKDYYRDLLSHLRQLLMRGQRRVAITFAQNNGLFDHAMALSYLFSFLSSSLNTTASTNLGQVIDNNLMISTIKKFITSTLSTDDPRMFYFNNIYSFLYHFCYFFFLSSLCILYSSFTNCVKYSKFCYIRKWWYDSIIGFWNNSKCQD